MKLLSMETALLLAVVTVKRVGDLHALSGSAECMRFDDDGLRVVVKPTRLLCLRIISPAQCLLS